MKRSYESEGLDFVGSKRAKIEEPSDDTTLAFIDLPLDMICIIVSHLTYTQVVRLALTNKLWYFGSYWNGLIDLTFIGERVIENISNKQLNLALSKCEPKRLRCLQLIKCTNIDGKYLNSIINNFRAVNTLVLSQCPNLGNSTDLLDAILKLPYLENLDLSQNTWLNDNYFSERASKSIRSVNLNGCTRVTDDFIASMTVCCPNLESLSLSGCFRLTDQAAIIISSKFPKIKQLDLSYCDDITDVAVGHLTKSEKLRDLNISHTAVTGSGIKAFSMSQTPPDLAQLMISGLKKVDQDATMQLTRFSSLKLLDMTRNEILSMSTIASLVTFLPKLEMLYYSIGSFMRVADHDSILTIRKNYLNDSSL